MRTAVRTGTSLLEVAGHLPENAYNLDAVGERIGLTDREKVRYRRFLGLNSVRWAPEARQVDLLLSAARRLRRLRGNENRVRYVMHARTVEPAAPYSANPLRAAVDELGLGHAQAFSVSQHACASGLLAVDLAGRLLAADGDPDALALVLTGEKTYPHVAKYMPGSMIMAEGSAACLVRSGGDRDVLLAYTHRTHGEFADIADDSAETALEFGERYPTALADVITTATSAIGKKPADLALILPHNVNRISWTRLCHALNLPFTAVMLDNIPVTGHCFCADTFINHDHAVSRGLLRAGDLYLMVSVGLGATFSAMLFRR